MNKSKTRTQVYSKEKSYLSQTNNIDVIILYIVGLLVIFGMYLSFDHFFASILLKLKPEIYGQIGDYIGGTAGSIWALAGVILFYLALREQRKDLKINHRTLELQVEELEKQRSEMEHSRKIFEMQLKTQDLQRFENTFFKLLNLHNQKIDGLYHFVSSETYKGRACFRMGYKILDDRINNSYFNYVDDGYGGYNQQEKKIDNVKLAEDLLKETYDLFYQDIVGNVFIHYFVSTTYILEFIHTSPSIEKKDKNYYAAIFRSQLSNDELFLIFYHSLIHIKGERLFELCLYYNIFDNFDFSLLSEHKFHMDIYKSKINNY